MKSTKTFNWFRKIAFAEGVSFLVLLLIAMPLKYFANLPIAVTIVGGLHGFLFVAFVAIAWLYCFYYTSWYFLDGSYPMEKRRSDDYKSKGIIDGKIFQN
jgi:integral membrane protein